tara:strand:- start:2672 stop:3697 length:1026 start_codon:yes stop_codon:yes gene_type:complete
MVLHNNTILVTGAAGFIGAALVKRLIKKGETIIGIDNLNNYYSQDLKIARLESLEKFKGKNWSFHKQELEDKTSIAKIFEEYKPNIVVHLAAQAGVRYSIDNPDEYIRSNLVGFSNLIDIARKNSISNFIYASSSSVYGGNRKLPFHEDDGVNHPISLYAATKKSNELIAHSYSNIFNLPTTGLRFFTVYGPWGRPDMAPILFAKAIMKEEPIKIFNYGKMSRDFTYIEDVIEAVEKCCYKKALINKEFNELDPLPSSSFCPARIFNVGNNKPTNLLNFIEILEDKLGKIAKKEFLPLQEGDVISTSASIEKIQDWIQYNPNFSLEVGLENFAKWFKDYYK